MTRMSQYRTSQIWSVLYLSCILPRLFVRRPNVRDQPRPQAVGCMPWFDSFIPRTLYGSLHLDDLEGGIRRQRPTFPGLSKARLAVQGEGGRAVSWSPQTESA